MDALLFDMDGVVVDSEDHWHPAEREDLLPAVLAGEVPDVGEITGMPYREIYAYLDANYETTVSEAEFVDRYDETAAGIYQERVELLDGLSGIRERAREAGVPVGLVSSSPPTWMGYVLDRFGLAFDLTLSNDQVPGPGKPEPDIYEAAADRLGVEPSACVAVEDSRNGSLAAQRAGMVVVGYRVDHNAETDLSACDVVCAGSEELREELLGRLTG
ncbi:MULTISPECIES: HAD family hydrolase [Halolamina]|uniref:Haloacid dehalogenase superfamily, subfamily IA, variant 3 with third motif having DD or ED/haloacid dehalogenase superfamily, subfamily IA, variant 1 with third motif having Dx(3-4)D or Dx(3-4)E n=1 Tax=Halolamina pelagica TaxID=699431 RepID=A0A1I5SNM6_9EURY|nr:MULTISPECIES: HAD family phosphatase [Halolamina]NHX36965.1 HAD family phosphatase [Halolamina sp. R1-12]SFP72353.1 haloacid dehalogenase superfamily, subfamily IA, variant 3 with third motif having DD or ED/haloacid dehalogenase superfamily, subfamily IA, variant 1 with third motif having Dx(3-4)D or Dx(3-4)E [Halolamina pelagica]